jgi:hypothetical protein
VQENHSNPNEPQARTEMGNLLHCDETLQYSTPFHTFSAIDPHNDDTGNRKPCTLDGIGKNGNAMTVDDGYVAATANSASTAIIVVEEEDVELSLCRFDDDNLILIINDTHGVFFVALC